MSGRGSQDGHRPSDSVPTLQKREFAALYERAYRVLWIIAAGMVGRSAAADVVHQAAVQALGKLGQFERGTNFTAWMATFVRYVAMNHVRTERRCTALPLDEQRDTAAQTHEAAPPVQLGKHGDLADHQPYFDDELMRALATLPAVARACLLLRTVQEMSYVDIAEALDIPQGTAMSHVHRSRHQIRKLLQQAPASAVGQEDRQR